MNIGILIPVYNEEVVIKATLDSLIDAGFTHAQINIIDDCSTDSTFLLLEEYGINAHRMPINGGKAAAQRYALHSLGIIDQYDYLLFLDGDTKLDSSFKSELEQAVVTDPDHGLYVCQVVSSKSDNLFSAYRAVEYTFSHDIIKKGQDNFNLVYVSPGCASLYKSSVLKQLDLDSTILAEDMDLTIQTHRLKEKVKYVHSAKVITQDPRDYPDYLKQITRWYRGFWQVVKKHRILCPGKKQSVDLYLLYLILDSLLFNKISVLIFMTTLLPISAIFLWITMDFAIYIVVCVYAIIKTKRPDIIKYIPRIYFISYINLYAFFKSFIEVLVLRKNNYSWNKVNRYKFT